MMRLWWLVIIAASLLGADGNSVLIRNVTVHPVTAPDLENGSVLVVDGKVEEVGRKVAGRPGVRVIDGRGLQLYPGIINAATNVGLSEVEAVRDTVDLDEIGEFNPELRAEVVFNPSSEHVPVTRAAGITSVVTLPGSGSPGGRFGGPNPVITGQGALMHLNGWTWEEMAVRRSAVMDMLFPAIRPVPPQTGMPTPGSAPHTFQEEERQYREELGKISQFLEDARRYQKARSAGHSDFHRDLKLEAMSGVLEGTQPLLVRAGRERMIKDAISFADKEKIRIIIANPQEIGATGPALKERKIPVVLGKVLTLPEHDDDPYDAPYTLPNDFYRAGVKICFGTFDVEFARNVAFEAAQAAAFGLPKAEALKALTINSAEILGVASQIGSVERGKLADLILTDGDPLEARTNIKLIFIAGHEILPESRHTREYDHWIKRP